MTTGHHQHMSRPQTWWLHAKHQQGKLNLGQNKSTKSYNQLDMMDDCTLHFLKDSEGCEKTTYSWFDQPTMQFLMEASKLLRQTLCNLLKQYNHILSSRSMSLRPFYKSRQLKIVQVQHLLDLRYRPCRSSCTALNYTVIRQKG